MQRGKVFEILDRSHHIVVDHGGAIELRSAVDDPMAHRDDTFGPQIVSGLGEEIEDLRKTGLVIGDLTDELVLLVTLHVLDPRLRLADPLHQAVSHNRTRVGLHQLIFQRRRACVEHQDGVVGIALGCHVIAPRRLVDPGPGSR